MVEINLVLLFQWAWGRGGGCSLIDTSPLTCGKRDQCPTMLKKVLLYGKKNTIFWREQPRMASQHQLVRSGTQIAFDS